jgi:DNA topoisomerase-3
VAEKPSVARTVTEILSKRNFEKTESLSKYNPVYEFDYKIKDQEYKMKFTSVTGHLMNYDFKNKTKWELKETEDLYNMDIVKFIKNDSLHIVSNLDELAT